MNLINLQEAHRKWVDFSELHQKKTVYWSCLLYTSYDILPKLTIYSIVNSLVEGTEATQVQITINGESKAKYMGTVDLSQPLKENLELVAADDKK